MHGSKIFLRLRTIKFEMMQLARPTALNAIKDLATSGTETPLLVLAHLPIRNLKA
jgi:hypothetical protein